MKPIKKYSSEELIQKIAELDISTFKDVDSFNLDENGLLNFLEENINPEEFEDKTVLGIDIYHYSQYKPLEQTLIPIVFKIIFEQAASLCIINSSYMFQKYKNVETFDKLFISTGDGGFLVFDTPLHAIAFTINFQMVVRYYNSHRFYPKLRKIVGAISLRYALTTDKVYRLNRNYYGTAIINNSRILDKDSLNRFLLDKNTYNWFLRKLNGIENLQIVSIHDLSKISDFEDYDLKLNGNNDIYPENNYNEPEGVTAIDIEEIGNIVSKSTSLSIYNLHLQYIGSLSNENRKIIITIGNLNTSGIN